MKIYEIVTEARSDEGIADIAKGAATGIAKGAKWAKDAVTGTKAGAEVAKDAGKAKKGAEVAKDVAKNADKVKASAEAVSKVKSFGSAYVSILSALGITYYVYGYWTEVLKLEAEWTEYTNSIKSKSQVPSTNRFAGKDYEKALDEAENMRSDLLGKAVTGCLMSAGIFGKMLQVFGTLFKAIPIFGPLIGSPIVGVGWLISKLEGSGALSATIRASFLTWLETTDSGKEFMKNVFVVLILGGVGKVAASAIDALMGLADIAVEFINEKFGTNIPKPSTTGLGTKIKPDAEAEKEIDANIKTIDGVPATTADGYLRSDRPFWVHNKVKWEIEKQMNKGQPNPLDSIPKNPKLTYPTDLFRNLNYSG
jgi:hypothetical protein